MLCEITIPGTLLIVNYTTGGGELITIINHTSNGLAMSQARLLAETGK